MPSSSFLFVLFFLELTCFWLKAPLAFIKVSLLLFSRVKIKKKKQEKKTYASVIVKVKGHCQVSLSAVWASMPRIPQPEDGRSFSYCSVDTSLSAEKRATWSAQKTLAGTTATTSVERLTPAGQLDPLSLPPRSLGLEDELRLGARACCSLCRSVEPCSNASPIICSPCRCWDTQATSV